MKKIQKFFSLKYYQKALRDGTGIRFIWALLLITLLNTVFTSFIFLKNVLPVAHNLPQQIQQAATKFLPEDVEVQIKNGHASTNANEPYYLNYDPAAFGSLGKFGSYFSSLPKQKMRLLVIDTKATSDDFLRYQTMFLLTGTSLTYYNKGEIKVQPLNGIQDMTINKTIVMQKINHFMAAPLMKHLGIVLIIAAPIGLFLLSFIIQIVGLIWLFIMVFLFAKIYGQRYSMKRLIHFTGVIFFVVCLCFDVWSYVPVIHQFITNNIPKYLMLLFLFAVMANINTTRMWLAVFFLPVIVLYDILRSVGPWYKKLLLILVSVTLIGLSWWHVGSDVFMIGRVEGLRYGLFDSMTKLPVSGTSMFPTIKDKSTVTLHNPKKYGLHRGDAVSFSNTSTGGLHFLKRIVGLPGETLAIVNGSVYINNQPLSEPYLPTGTKTYGNIFSLDCQKITIPKQNYFVMGDNRAVSYDSRAIGFVFQSAIDGMIKANELPKLPASESASMSQTQFIASDVVKLLNDVRRQNNVGPLVTNSTLTQVAQNRSQDIVDHFDFWKKSEIPVEKFIDSTGYRYNLVHEYVTFGYLDAQELVNQIIENGTEKELFLSPQYYEVGVASTTRTDGACAYPVISMIISWPSIPTYDQATIDSWIKSSAADQKVISDLQSWVGFGRYNDDDLRALITKVSQDAEICARIENKMQNREWLTAQDYSDIRLHNSLIPEINAGLQKLFGPQVQGAKTSRLQELW